VLRDAGADAVAFHHDLSLVALSYVIAAAGSYTALEMIERRRSAHGVSKRYWQFRSAAALGGGIWSMHFIAMLALKIDLPMNYALGPTLLSLLIGIGVVGWGLQIVRCSGLGVATMHYIGMAALRFPGSLAYNPFPCLSDLATCGCRSDHGRGDLRHALHGNGCDGF
jgi:NO-binding membrane sensor protein with MHYT domain